jgi:hypothetical protein
MSDVRAKNYMKNTLRSSNFKKTQIMSFKSLKI